jgi:D-beta-D-heptose 7-phosphate kinase/D-beta-D-heptose 1-phosphate adenosyltransferase
MDTAVKRMTRSEACAWRESQRGSIVFTNGVFDLLHPGSVILRRRARWATRSSWAPNTDASVRRLGKGDRPVNSEKHGAACWRPSRRWTW